MVTLNRKTFEDLLGNVADDAKQALDEILERRRKAESSTRPGPRRATSGAPTLAGDSVGGVADGTANLNVTAESLATLPEQIAELTEVVTALRAAVETLSGALETVGKAADAGKTPVSPKARTGQASGSTSKKRKTASSARRASGGKPGD